MYCNVSKYMNINYESHQVGNLKALSAVVAPAKDGLIRKQILYLCALEIVFLYLIISALPDHT